MNTLSATTKFIKLEYSFVVADAGNDSTTRDTTVFKAHPKIKVLLQVIGSYFSSIDYLFYKN